MPELYYLGREGEELRKLKEQDRKAAWARRKRMGGAALLIVLAFGGVTVIGVAVSTTTPTPGEAPATPGCIVVFKAGDTRAGLLDRSGTNVAELRRYNPELDTERLEPGDEVEVSECGDLGEDHEVTPLP